MKQLNAMVKRVDAFQQRHRLTAFIYAVIKKYTNENVGHQAALLTYYGFLALFPLLMVLTTLVNNLVGSNSELGKAITSGLNDFFPLLGNQLSSNVGGLNSSGLALVIGILFTLYGARGVAEVFSKGMQDIWSIPKKDRPGFPANTLRSFVLVAVGGLGFILASIAASLAAGVGHGIAIRALSIGVNLLILYGLFNLLLNLSLPKHVTFKETRLGATVAAVGLVLLQILGGYILARQLKSLDALYSYFAIALGLLFWIYLQAQVIYYAAVAALVSSHKLWPRSLNEPPAE